MMASILIAGGVIVICTFAISTVVFFALVAKDVCEYMDKD